jgi:hypothetical protein
LHQSYMQRAVLPSIYPSIYLPFDLPIYVPISWPIHLRTSICSSIDPSIKPSIHLFRDPLIYLFIPHWSTHRSSHTITPSSRKTSNHEVPNTTPRDARQVLDRAPPPPSPPPTRVHRDDSDRLFQILNQTFFPKLLLCHVLCDFMCCYLVRIIYSHSWVVFT